jgi:transcriptional regulator with XRE-family HTH domain
MAKRLGIRIATLDFIEADIWPERTSVRLLFRIHHYFGIPPKTILTDRLHDFQTESCIQLQSHP